MFLAAKQLGSEEAKCDLDAKRQSLLRFELFRKIKKILDLIKRNILISPLEGEKKFLSELCEFRNFREGYNLKRSSRNSNFNRRLYFLKNINCDSDMLHHDKNYKGRLGILAQHEAGFEPSPAFVMLTGVRKRLLPLTKREGSDSVISNNYSDTNHSRLTTHYSLISDTVFSRFTSHFSRKRTAFTLAEVLITLGIIGIVACMTLPSIINKYQSKVFETTFKKQYSVLQNAIDYSTMVNAYQNCYLYYPKGNISYQFKLDDCVALGNDLVENLKLTPISKTVLNNYKRSAEIHATGGNSINWACSYDYSLGEAIPYVSPDGVIFMISVYAKFFPSIIIDVNGEKGPNKWGYDVFFMVLSNHNEATSKVLLTDEYCSIIEKGGRFPRTILQNKQLVDGSDLGITWK